MSLLLLRPDQTTWALITSVSSHFFQAHISDCTSFFISKLCLPPTPFPRTCNSLYVIILCNCLASSPTIPCVGGILVISTLVTHGAVSWLSNFAEAVPLTGIFFLCFVVWRTSTHLTRLKLGAASKQAFMTPTILVSGLASRLPSTL